MSWINVKDQLPENNDTIVVICDDGIVTAIFHYDYSKCGCKMGEE